MRGHQITSAPPSQGPRPVPLTAIGLDLPALDHVKDDALVALIFTDDRPPRGLAGLIDWRTDGTISRMSAAGRISGDDGECTLFSTSNRTGCGFILFVGLGKRSGLGSAEMRNAAAVVREKLERAGVKTFAFSIPPLDETRITWNEAMSAWLTETLSGKAWDGITIIDDTDRVRKFIASPPENLRRRMVLHT